MCGADTNPILTTGLRVGCSKADVDRCPQRVDSARSRELTIEAPASRSRRVKKQGYPLSSFLRIQSVAQYVSPKAPISVVTNDLVMGWRGLRSAVSRDDTDRPTY